MDHRPFQGDPHITLANAISYYPLIHITWYIYLRLLTEQQPWGWPVCNANYNYASFIRHFFTLALAETLQTSMVGTSPPKRETLANFCLQWTMSPTEWKYCSYPHNRRSRWLHSGVSWLVSSQWETSKMRNEPMTMCYVWLILYTPINDGPIGRKYMYLNVNDAIWME